jgi:predicted phage terminase large subunit-like protein
MIVQSWDTAIKAGKAHDASACATFRVRDNMHQLIDMLVIKAEYPLLKRMVCTHAARFAPDAILMEDKASGQSLLQDLRELPDLPLIAMMPKGDKISRLARASALVEAGSVALPYRAPWLAAFEAEIMGFPNMAHDDQVDAFSQYLCWVLDRNKRANPMIRRI